MKQDENEAAPAPDWQLFTAYEAGKGRRYGLLFAVNGGGYALLGFLLANDGALIAPALLIWALMVLPLLMIVYNWIMCNDIRAFGQAMRAMDARPPHQRLFGPAGQSHLEMVRWLLVIAWLLAFLFAAWVLLSGGRLSLPAPAAA